MNRRQTVIEKLNRAGGLIPTMRTHISNIDAQLAPDVGGRSRYETFEEYSARLAAERGRAKVATERKFRDDAWTYGRDLTSEHRQAHDGALRDVKSARERVRDQYDHARLAARRDEYRARFAASSQPMVGSDLGQRIAREYERARLAEDAEGMKALRLEFGEAAAKADPRDESTDTRALRNLHHTFTADDEADDAPLAEAEAELAAVEALAPQVASMVRALQDECGLTPVSADMFVGAERGPMEQELLGLARFAEDPAAALADAQAAPEPQVDRLPESDAERMARLA